MVKFFKREIPDFNGKGEKQYRYQVRSMGNCDLTDIARRMAHRHSKYNDVAMEGLMTDVIDEVATALSEGFSVSLGKLGTFSLKLGMKQSAKDKREGLSKAQQSATEPNARSVCVRGINYKPDKNFITHLNVNCKLQREEHGIVEIKQSPYTLEERIKLAVDYLHQHSIMRTHNYAELCGLSKSTASRELREIVGRKKSPITKSGSRAALIYFLKPEKN